MVMYQKHIMINCLNIKRMRIFKKLILNNNKEVEFVRERDRETYRGLEVGAL